MSRKSEETKRKMSEARKKWWAERTPEEREEFGQRQRGEKRPKVSLALKGRTRKVKELSGRWIKCHNDGCENRLYRSPAQLEITPSPFCSRECLNDWKRRNIGGSEGYDAAGRRARKIKGVTVPCSNDCGKEIYRTPSNLERFENAFCSNKCFGEYYSKKAREKNLVRCLWCDVEFYRPPGREKYNGGNHYCCREHSYLGRSGENHPGWKGGRTERGDGYIDINGSLVPEKLKSMVRREGRSKNGRVFEHRLVMAIHLDRPLKDWEVVHHKNGVRNDNRIENLELHPFYTHIGITVVENRRVKALEKERDELLTRLAEIEQKLSGNR